jgi:guanylate kinase
MSSRPNPERGVLFVVSAPSGTGKTTVVERLVERYPQVWRSRSYTSRPPRIGEVEGVDYNFVSRERFDQMARRGAFLEWADIFGNLYGTSQRDTEAALGAGIDLVLVIDVQGARQVRTRKPEAVAIFLLPPSFEMLATRLRGRNQDSSEAIERRLETARAEVAAVDEYDYVIVNDDVEHCLSELGAIITAEHARRQRRRVRLDPIIRTFADP